MYVHALLDHALGHHAHCVLQRLPLVAEPNADHFALVAKLVGQAGDFGSCPRREVNWKVKGNIKTLARK